MAGPAYPETIGMFGETFMSTLTIRMPDDKTERLKALARGRGISMNKLVEEWATQALAEWDVERRFQIMAAQGNIETALRVLERLDAI